MLDPKEMKKGGFGAFAAMDRERQAVRAAESATTATNSATPLAATEGAAPPEPGPQPRPPGAERADKTTTRPAGGA